MTGVRELTYLVAATLDGFVAGPNGGDPTGPDGFWPISEAYVAHLAATWPETLPAGARTALGIDGPPAVFDTVLEGRGSYDVGLAAGVDDAYPHLRHVVFSRTLGRAPADGVEVEAGDPVARVRELKREPGAGLWLVGGPTLAGVLLDEVDRLVLKVAPVTVGRGLPLFGDAPFGAVGWRRTGLTELEGGTLVLEHERA